MNINLLCVYPNNNEFMQNRNKKTRNNHTRIQKFTWFGNSGRAGPSTRRVRQLPKGPKWKGGPKILERSSSRGKKWFEMNPKKFGTSFDQKTKFLLYPVKHW